MHNSGSTSSDHTELSNLATNRFYSPQSLLLVIFATLSFDMYVFVYLGDFKAKVGFHDAIYGAVSLGLRSGAILSLFAVLWLKRPDSRMAEAPEESRWVPWLQGAFPVLAVSAFSAHMIKELYEGTCSSEGKIVTQAALQLFPFLTFFVLRDTKIEALALAWSIASITLLLFAIQRGTTDHFGGFFSYMFATIVIPYDSVRQERAIDSLVAKLRATLQENERLAVEAQALELRAMIGNVAHDLKTPLTSILSGIECMTEVLSSWEGAAQSEGYAAKAAESLGALRNCLKNMHGSTSFMTMTINRCIDYTKASKGVKLVPKMETAVVQAKLELPVQLLCHSQSDIAIKILPVDPAICTHIITDRQWLLENLLCLLSNAVKYSHKGTVEVGVRLVEGKQGEGEDLQPQPMLRFEVQDTGIGLSEEAMQTLFNPFKQAQRLAGGTGLGLFSLAKRVEALQGQYGVCKRPDGAQGSLFWFTIPYRPDQQSASLVENERIRRADSVCVDGDVKPVQVQLHNTSPFGSSADCLDVHTIGVLPPQSVLVVDDAPLIVKMTTMLLGRKGHSVESAVNGAAALEKLLQGYETIQQQNGDEEGTAPARCTPYDVVLMDLQMPVLDGIETVRRLRAAEQEMQRKWSQEHGGDEQQEVQGEEELHVCRLASTEVAALFTRPLSPPPQQRFHQLVISLSANSDEETRRSALEAGADAFMPKPFTYENFLEVMEHRMEFAAAEK